MRFSYDFEKMAHGIKLSAGAHVSPEDGLCSMEMVAFVTGLPHSDCPECTCPVIAAFVRTFQDRLPDDQRHRMMAYILRLIDTVSPEHERERAEYLARQAVTVLAPKVLERAGFVSLTERPRGFPFHDWVAAARAVVSAKIAVDAAADSPLAAGFEIHAFLPAEAAEAVAAYATFAEAAADSSDPWQIGFDLLDGVLGIGSAGEFSAPPELVEERVRTVRGLVGAS